MNTSVRKAIEDRLSFLEDNLYRHKHFSGGNPDYEAIKNHEKEIAELKKELER